MQMITELMVAVLLAYLAFTNTLAEKLSILLGEGDTTEQEAVSGTTVSTQAEVVEPGDTPTVLTSIFKQIPDILRNNADYQKAAVITGTLPVSTLAVDPLDAIVNIYCTFTTDQSVRTTTGTGFIVSDSGIILTNAHVAQFLLLDSAGTLGEGNCSIRTGSPAAPRYNAELLYIPPAWVQEHAGLAKELTPSGTGERDYALLHITSSLDGTKLPEKFPALPLQTTPLTASSISGTITAAGYPAIYTDGNTDTNLQARSATTSISELFTFGKNEVDVLALRGSNMGQQGSSGGPVVNEAGQVIGMITTRGNDNVDGVGSLRAISIDHINRTITEETEVPLPQHLAGDIEARSQIFTNTMRPFLINIMTKEVPVE